MSLFPLRRRFLVSSLATACLLTAASGTAEAQVRPATPPVYPPPAPMASDTTRANQVGQAQEFAVPSVVGQGPSKGVIAHLEGLADFKIDSQIRDKDPNTTANTSVTKNRRAFIKGYIPAWNNPHLKVILGFNYDREEFQFEDPNKSSFYRNLEDKGLKTLGAQLAVIRPVDKVHWYIARVKGELNGDYTSSELNVSDYLKMSGEFIYGWKRNPYLSWGVGAQIGYTFGRQSIYPVILYNRTFNQRWGVESLFPARVSVRHNVNPKTLLFGGYTVDGMNYNIKLREPLANGLQTLIIRETELKLRLRVEREIYDFLWFGLEGGYRYNVNFNAVDAASNERTLPQLFSGSRNRLVTNNLGTAPYASIEIFLVPPRKFLNKTSGGR